MGWSRKGATIYCKTPLPSITLHMLCRIENDSGTLQRTLQQIDYNVKKMPFWEFQSICRAVNSYFFVHFTIVKYWKLVRG